MARQELILALPGLVSGEMYGVPLKKDNLPETYEITAEPWDTIRINPMESPLKILGLYSPRKVNPKKVLLDIGGKFKIGYGQKIIVPAAPASGKTTLLTDIGKEIIKKKRGNVTNLLIDERPEEKLAGRNVSNINLSYMRSPNDILLGSLDAISKAMKRVLLHKTNEIIFMDSLTRFVGIVDSIILEKYPSTPSGTGGITLASRRFVRTILGLANNFSQGGSLTIIATTLVGGSSVEDVIYKDLKGVSNAEIFINKIRNLSPSHNNKDSNSIIDRVDLRKSYVRNQSLIK